MCLKVVTKVTEVACWEGAIFSIPCIVWCLAWPISGANTPWLPLQSRYSLPCPCMCSLPLLPAFSFSGEKAGCKGRLYLQAHASCKQHCDSILHVPVYHIMYGTAILISNFNDFHLGTACLIRDRCAILLELNDSKNRTRKEENKRLLSNERGWDLAVSLPGFLLLPL